MAAKDKNGRSSPSQNKAAASAKVLPPANKSSIELNEDKEEDEVRADEQQSEANHCPMTNQVSSAV